MSEIEQADMAFAVDRLVASFEIQRRTVVAGVEWVYVPALGGWVLPERAA